MTKENLLAKVKLLFPAAPESALDFACDLTIEQICNYCSLTAVPDGLQSTAAMMVRGLIYTVGLDGAPQPAVKAVSRGDTSYSFASVAEQMAQLAAAGDFLTDYRTQLNAYRKMR